MFFRPRNFAQYKVEPRDEIIQGQGQFWVNLHPASCFCAHFSLNIFSFQPPTNDTCEVLFEKEPTKIPSKISPPLLLRFNFTSYSGKDVFVLEVGGGDSRGGGEKENVFS